MNWPSRDIYSDPKQLAETAGNLFGLHICLNSLNSVESRTSKLVESREEAANTATQER